MAGEIDFVTNVNRFIDGRETLRHSRSMSRSRLAKSWSTANVSTIKRMMGNMSWYVLYKERAVNALQRLDDRDSAISAAFALSYRGHELIELGRIGGRDGEVIGSSAIARLLAQYEHRASPPPPPPRSPHPILPSTSFHRTTH